MPLSRDQLIALTMDYAEGYGIDPRVAVAQINAESAFRSDIVYGPTVSSAGARGMTQFIAGTWQRFGEGSFDKAWDPDYSLTAWGNYMTYLLNLFDWDYRKALMAYNGGEGHLLNPDRYGPVSPAAQRYADSILLAAGAASSTSGVPTPSGSWNDSGFTKWAIIGGLALVAFAFLSD